MIPRKLINELARNYTDDTKCFGPAKWARSRHNKAVKRRHSRRVRALLKKEMKNE